MGAAENSVLPAVRDWPRLRLGLDSSAPVLLRACARRASMIALRGNNRIGTTTCTAAGSHIVCHASSTGVTRCEAPERGHAAARMTLDMSCHRGGEHKGHAGRNLFLILCPLPPTPDLTPNAYAEVEKLLEWAEPRHGRVHESAVTCCMAHVRKYIKTDRTSRHARHGAELRPRQERRFRAAHRALSSVGRGSGREGV